MIYSVFDWDGGRKSPYIYLEGPGEALGVRPKPRTDVNGENGVGQKLEDVLPVVPVGARVVGRGDTPRGRIAILSPELRAQLGGFSGTDPGSPTGNPLLDHPWVTLGFWAVAFYYGTKLAIAAGRRAAGVK